MTVGGNTVSGTSHANKTLDVAMEDYFTAGYKPALMFHHGVVTDNLYKAGDCEEIVRRLGVIRKTGITVGLCTHMPEVIEYAELHHWDLDFYMGCVPAGKTGAALEGMGKS